VFHPIGGCGALTQALTRVGETLGVKYRFGEAVTQILFQRARAIGVATEAGEYRANAVVINADFARAIQRLVPDYLRKSWSDANIERKRMSCSGFMLYLGIDGLYKNVPHHTIYIAKDYARNMDEIENRHVLSADPSYYLQNAGVTDPTLAPKGQSTLYVLAPVTHGHTNVDWSREAARYRALVLDKLAAVGVTDVASRIVYERMVTPKDWDGAFELHHGSLFSLAHNWSQMLHLRPHNGSMN
jgi:phytoene desaturase